MIIIELLGDVDFRKLDSPDTKITDMKYSIGIL